MKTKQFHIGDVLSITTSRLVSPTRIDGVYDILNFMTGESLFTHQLPRAADVCKPYLLEQFPQLDSPEMQFALGELIEMLDTPSGKKEPDKLITGWISKIMSGRYGFKCDETLIVQALPDGAYESMTPFEELKKVTPNATVIPISPD